MKRSRAIVGLALLGAALLPGWGAPAAPSAAGPVLPPLPPLSASPVQFFRGLLETNAAGREAVLADRTAEQRKLLEAKLNEYLALPAADREIRLALTELRWYLLAVLRAPADYREQFVAQVPEKYRSLVRERLQIWDGLSPESRRDLIENEPAMSYLIRLENSTPPQSRAILASLPEDKRRQVEQALLAWRAMTAEQRTAAASRFQQFFEFTEKEKRQTLARLPEAQREQAESLLAAFERLPSGQRDKCLNSFQKYLALNPAEREQFLANLARWQAMTPEQRQAVRQSLQQLPPIPPLPPKFFSDSTQTISAAASGK